jgi:hypothetical protein
MHAALIYIYVCILAANNIECTARIVSAGERTVSLEASRHFGVLLVFYFV